MTWNKPSADHDDPILDACLDEVLANRAPPDVTPRVLRALHGAELPEPPPIQSQVGAAPSIVIVSPRGEVQSSKLPAPSSAGFWSSAIAVALAAGVIGVGL